MDDADISAEAREDFAIVSMAARAGEDDALAEAIQAGLGMTLPPPGKCVTADGLTLLCTTPAQWLILHEHVDDGLFDSLSDLVGERALLIDLSGSRVAVRVSGTAARRVLAKGLPLDLHPRAMRPGDAASTLVAHLSVSIWQIDDTPTYELICARSFAGSFYRWLELAGAAVARG